MVGIPGRSKGCMACRKRKKGCDLQTPKCGQCRKACLPCQAYVKQYFFAHDVSTKIRPWMAALNGAPNADKPLTTAAYATNMVDLFWSAYLPNGRQPTDWGIRIPRALFDAASTLYTTGGSGGAPSNASSAAVSAIALTTTGVKNGDDSLVKEGTRRYTEALQATATALALPSPQAKQRFSVLVAVRILSLYEALHGEDDGTHQLVQARSWMAHCHGDVTLTVREEPEWYISGIQHDLFVDGRLHLIATAVQDRKASFLNEEAWKTIPWTKQPKTAKDHVVDVLVEVPAILEKLDDMKSREYEEQAVIAAQLTTLCSKLDKDLETWANRFGERSSGGGSSSSSSSSSMMPESEKSDQLGRAHTMTLYWATCIVISGLQKALADFNNNTGPTVNKMHIDPDVCCQKIIERVPIFLDPAVGIFRVHLATVPMSVAMTHLSATEPHRMVEQRRQLAAQLRRPECASIRRFLASMETKAFGALEDL